MCDSSPVTDITLASFHWSRDFTSSTISTSWPSTKSPLVPNHFCLFLRVTTYSCTHLFQKASTNALAFWNEYLNDSPPGGAGGSIAALVVSFTPGYSIPAGDRASISFGSSLTCVIGLKFKIASTCANIVTSTSNSSGCLPNTLFRCFFTDFIILSHTPALWCAMGGRNIHSKHVTLAPAMAVLFHDSTALFNSASAPTKFVPQSLYSFLTPGRLDVNLISAIKNDGVDMVSTISRWIALVFRHVKITTHLLAVLLALCFTMYGPKQSTPLTENASPTSSLSTGSGAIFWSIGLPLCIWHFTHFATTFLTQIPSFIMWYFSLSMLLVKAVPPCDILSWVCLTRSSTILSSLGNMIGHFVSYSNVSDFISLEPALNNPSLSMNTFSFLSFEFLSVSSSLWFGSLIFLFFTFFHSLGKWSLCRPLLINTSALSLSSAVTSVSTSVFSPFFVSFFNALKHFSIVATASTRCCQPFSLLAHFITNGSSVGGSSGTTSTAPISMSSNVLGGSSRHHCSLFSHRNFGPVRKISHFSFSFGFNPLEQ